MGGCSRCIVGRRNPKQKAKYNGDRIKRVVQMFVSEGPDTWTLRSQVNEISTKK